ncbi:MAG TPA: DUF2892 domain-containing protein [Draconibacterium sp.]|nr:DUF2892 domain-containing protein [Draconibacterium sp.]
MKKNLGSFDRIVRLLLAALFVILYFTQPVTGTLGILLLIVAGIFVITSLAGVCPLYLMLKIKTIKSKK